MREHAENMLDSSFSEQFLFSAVDNTILIVLFPSPKSARDEALRNAKKPKIDSRKEVCKCSVVWFFWIFIRMELGRECERFEENWCIKFNAWWIFETNEILIIY